jgi:nucleoside-diphosphate-sugar epimerase
MLEYSKINKVERVIYASSSAVYGDTNEIPINEESSLIQSSPYGFSKFLNELFADRYDSWFNLKSTGLRFFNVYGPRQKSDSPYSGVISIFSNKMRQKESISIYGDGEQIRDFVYVKDVVQAILLSANSRHQTNIYNVGSGNYKSVNELYKELATLLHYDRTPVYKDGREGDIRKSSADISLIKKELGYLPKFGFKKGLYELLAQK